MLKFCTIAATAIVIGGAANATTSSLIGDKDCFNTMGVCVEDGVTWIPGLWGITPEFDDAAPTDRELSTSSTTSWTHTFAAGIYTSATLTFLTAGIADIYGPYEVFVDNVSVGEMPLDGFGHILAETFSFGFAPSLASDGSVTVSFTSTSGDLWAIDYSEVVLEGNTPAVPLPAPALLLGSTLLAGGLMARRKRRG